MIDKTDSRHCRLECIWKVQKWLISKAYKTWSLKIVLKHPVIDDALE